MQQVPRVVATPAALHLIGQIVARHGDILFHQSGGCCDGSSPMCYPRGDFIIGDRDVKMGEIGGYPFFMSPSQVEYWQHTQLIIDAIPGRGGMFSLDNGTEHGSRPSLPLRERRPRCIRFRNG